MIYDRISGWCGQRWSSEQSQTSVRIESGGRVAQVVKLSLKRESNGFYQPAFDVAWHVAVFDWAAHGICGAAFHKRSHEACSAPGGSDEQNVFGSAWCCVE
jgi:hypothetical protein